MVDINLPYHRNDVNIKYDSDVFPREYNKIIKVGWIRKRNCLVKCNGNGKLTIMLETQTEKIEELYKLYKKGIITKSEFDSKRKELLDSIN